MKIDAFILSLDSLIVELKRDLPAIADEMALNTLALIKNRIVDSGRGVEGAQYSTKPMLTTKDQFVVKTAFKQTQIKGKKKTRGLWVKFPKASKAVPVMELPNGYRQFREIQGRPSAVVNLSLTGAMWRSITIVARVEGNGLYVSVIGSNNQEGQDKLKWMTEKYGDLLYLLPEEKKAVLAAAEKKLQAIFNKYFTE